MRGGYLHYAKGIAARMVCIRNLLLYANSHEMKVLEFRTAKAHLNHRAPQ